jgi:small-conductance mechanosensitive channel
LPSAKELNLEIRSFFASLNIGVSNWLFALAVAIASFAAMRAALCLFRGRLGRLSEERAHRPVAEVLKETLARTSNLAVIATACLVGLTVLDLPAPWNERVRNLWFLTLGAQLALYLHRAVAVGSRRYFRTHAAEPDDAPVSVAHTLIIWALQSAIWIVFLLAMLSNLGINVTTFVASLGIGGIAIALAVQNILGDLFASLSIAVDKPFEVGDAISVAGVSGKVEHVGLKTTRIRADSGEQIVIANAELLKNTVRNFKRMSNRRVQFALRVNPATPPALAAEVPAALKKIIEKQERVRFDRAHLKTLDPGWLEFEVVYFVLDASYAVYMDCQQAILLEAMQALGDLGISTSAAPQPLVLHADSDKPPTGTELAARRPAPVHTVSKGA